MGIADTTWDDLRVLLALHRHRSFLAAGKALGVSTSTAARRVEALEHALGRTLVHRSRAGTSVEPDAMELVHLAEQLELGLQAAARDRGGALDGTVRLSMGEGWIRPVTRILSDFRRTEPGLHFEVLAESRLVDVAQREADIAIRTARSSSHTLVERQVGHLRFGLYAASSYIERRLRDARLRAGDFTRHDFVGYALPWSKLPQAKWLEDQGAQRFVLRTNSDHATQEAAELGQGICVLADAQARGSALIRIESDVLPAPVPVFLVFHRELRRVPRVRAVLRVLEAGLRQGLA